MIVGIGVASDRSSSVSGDARSLRRRTWDGLRTFADFEAAGRVLPAGQLVCVSNAPLPVSTSAMTRAVRIDAVGVMNMTSPGQSARTAFCLNQVCLGRTGRQAGRSLVVRSYAAAPFGRPAVARS